MKKKLMAAASLAIALSLCNNALAQPSAPLSGFYLGAYAGYGVVNDMLGNEGQSAIGRLAFGYKTYCYQLSSLYGSVNVELGLQNGKTMAHNPAENDPDFNVDLPIVTVLNPVLDLLLGVSLQFAPDSGFYGFIKGGMAYRQLQFPSGNFVSDLNQISGEAQAGLGYMLSPNSRVVVYYQGIYADGSVNYRGDASGWITVSNIPTQQAGFLGFEIAI